MLHIVANPNARESGKRIFEEVGARLRAHGAAYRMYFSERRGHLAELAREISLAGEGVLVAMGGDGTLNEVLTGMRNMESVPLGLIPAGTGNDFAAAAKIPVGVAAVELLFSGEPKLTDYLECGQGRRSLNIAGLGIDVDILERCERKKHGSPRSKYYRSLLASLITYRGVGMQVTANGETKRFRALIAAACNGMQLGGGIRLCPPAVLDDGLLDLVVIECPNRLKLPYYLLKLKKGKILSLAPARHLLCKEVTVVPEVAGSAQYDGEIFPVETFSARIVSGKLKMYRG